jgi:hypothetical protein
MNTEEDDEFERIKMESGWRKRQVQVVVEDDYDALAQKQLASIKRDMRISLEDAAVRATHKVMAELETEQAPAIEDDDDIQDYKKPWRGLTFEDMKDERTHNFDFIHGARWAEKLLKERNT